MTTTILWVMLLLTESGEPFERLPIERVVEIGIPNHDAVYSLARALNLKIVDAGERKVTAYANDAQLRRLRDWGYSVQILSEDYRRWHEAPLGTYATYAEVCSTLYALARNYPVITKLETLGTSVQGRTILVMKVTSNSRLPANKPRVRLNGPHHGNEKIATEITLAFLKYLCENYATEPSVRALVDTREIWILPIFNVDGHVANNRYNAAGVDLNRDYGYEWDPSETPGPFSQVETQAMRNHSERNQIVLEFSYHSTASYVNYLWDNHPADPPDSAYIMSLASRYADSTYGSSTTRLTPINGYNWYEVHGSCQDFTFGVYGGIATTIETQQPSTRVRVDSICTANRRALLDQIRLAGWGIQGLVYDSLSGQPLFARVELLAPPRWITYTQPEVGDFHKMLPPGSYTLKVAANGYVPKVFENVVVPDTGVISLEVPLVRAANLSLCAVQRVVWLRRSDDNHRYRDWVTRALGEPDGTFYSLGPAPSTVVFDVDPQLFVRNQSGDDITVFATGRYSLAAANDWQGPWFTLGEGNGQMGFDLSSVSLDSARYLRLVSVDSVRLDGIVYTAMPLVGSETRLELPMVTGLACYPNPMRSKGVMDLILPNGANVGLDVIDITGRTVKRLVQQRLPAGSHEIVWNLTDENYQPVPSGCYFCRLVVGESIVVKKIVVER